MRHHGAPAAALRAELESHPFLARIPAVAVTGHFGPVLAGMLGAPLVDTVAATVTGLGAVGVKADSVLDLGGNSLTRIRLDERGRFSGFEANTLCAAGTGGFLDEQRQRMQLLDETVSEARGVDAPPTIASRCAVFAKSDLIHRQQEGYSKAELWSGLCRSLARTAVHTLYKGRPPSGRVAVVGGLALDEVVMKWLEPALGIQPVVPQWPDTVTALGAAQSAMPCREGWHRLESVEEQGAHSSRREPLLLKRSRHPSFEVAHAWVEEECEVRVHQQRLPALSRVYLGIDVGSTSTKLVLLAQDQGQTDTPLNVVADIYTRTKGDPIGAARRLLSVLGAMEARFQTRWEMLGVGTTGSGRKLVGEFVGADLVLNEISAHAAGAISEAGEVETIFEIGGQDAKYIRIIDGRVVDSNMNYVCAAGTGSFVEELARKLGMGVEEVGQATEGVAPPYTSDRCTVFMEQDVQKLIREKHSREEVMGAVLYSVFQNYIRKVVGHRPISKTRVFFQGATARNRGLVAALENLLDVEVVVSPLCHVMGALGVALEARRAVAGGKGSSFLGLEAARKGVSISQDTCTLCNNNCTISSLRREGGEVAASWGYLCGREPDQHGLRVDPGHEPFRVRSRLFAKEALSREKAIKTEIAMPRTLLLFSYGPFFRAFFGTLGYNIRWSNPSDSQTVLLGNQWSTADLCLPVKLAHGHVAQLLHDHPTLPVFVPHLISARETGKTSRSFFCPYNIGLPGMVDAAMELQGVDSGRLVRCAVDFRWGVNEAAQSMLAGLGQALGCDEAALRRAWASGVEAQRSFDGQVRGLGDAWLEERGLGGWPRGVGDKPGAEAAGHQGTGMGAASGLKGRPAVVFLGRSYNIHDKGSNLDIPAKMASLGFDVVPMEFLPLDSEPLAPEYGNMYWNSGRAILEAASYIRRTPGLFGCYLTNFSCGPDSFIQSDVEEIMGDKPMLTLELDEHGGDAGYWTRMEAFADVVRRWDGARGNSSPRRSGVIVKNQQERVLWIPPMHEVSPTLVSAVLRAAGIDARPLPVETPESFAMGRAHTRGTECVPCPATLGTFLDTVSKAPNEKHALFMPTASGPCRFGQYCSLHRRVLDKLGMEETPVVSWTSTDSYGGLKTSVRKRFWTALVLGDLLFKMRCRTLPYESRTGATEAAFQHYTQQLAMALERYWNIPAMMEEMRNEFQGLIDPDAPSKPLVGVVGEIYVRQNRFSNQDLITRIEAAGGEAWLAPISEWVLYTSYMEKWLARRRPWWQRIVTSLKDRFLEAEEHRLTALSMPLLHGRTEPSVGEVMAEGGRYFPFEFEGESILTVGRAVQFVKQGAAMVVNCAPFACMPGSMTGGILQAVQQQTGVPMLSLFYDGEGDINARLDTYLANIKAAAAGEGVVRRESEAVL